MTTRIGIYMYIQLNLKQW